MATIAVTIHSIMALIFAVGFLKQEGEGMYTSSEGNVKSHARREISAQIHQVPFSANKQTRRRPSRRLYIRDDDDCIIGASNDRRCPRIIVD